LAKRNEAPVADECIGNSKFATDQKLVFQKGQFPIPDHTGKLYSKVYPRKGGSKRLYCIGMVGDFLNRKIQKRGLLRQKGRGELV
jgi:hypothetical protein